MVEPGIIEDHDHASVLVNDVLHLIQEDLEQSLVAVAGDESEETTVFGTYRTHDIDMQPSAPAGDGGFRTPTCPNVVRGRIGPEGGFILKPEVWL